MCISLAKDFETYILFLLGKRFLLHLQNNPGNLGDHFPRTPGSILLLWMENCGAEMVC